MHEFDVEEAVAEAERSHHRCRDRRDPLLDRIGQRRWILEALERNRSRKHDRVDDAEDDDIAIADEAVERRLLSDKQVFDEERESDLACRELAQEPVERLEEARGN